MKVLKRYFWIPLLLLSGSLVAQKTTKYTHVVLDVQGKIELLNQKKSILLKEKDSIFLDKNSKINVASEDRKTAYVRLWNLDKSEYERGSGSLSNIIVRTATKTLKFANLNSRGDASAHTIFTNKGTILNVKEIPVRNEELDYFIEFYQSGELLGLKKISLDDRYLVIDENILIKELDFSNPNNLGRLGYYDDKGNKVYININYVFKEMKAVLSEIESVKKNLPKSNDIEYTLRKYIDTFYGPYAEFQYLANKLKK